MPPTLRHTSLLIQIAYQLAADSAEFIAVDLKAGSALFMPRGTWHRTETSAFSMSLNIIIRHPRQWTAY